MVGIFRRFGRIDRDVKGRRGRDVFKPVVDGVGRDEESGSGDVGRRRFRRRVAGRGHGVSVRSIVVYYQVVMLRIEFDEVAMVGWRC